jgi:Flp pilus assembly protein TadG
MSGLFRNSERGAALVEMAVVTPLLIVLMVGVVDMARTFYMALELTNAARAGAQAGSKTASGFSSADVQAAAEAASPQIAPYTVATPTQSCFCINASGASTAHSCTTACPTTEYLAVYVTVTASKQFQTVMHFPGIPDTLDLSRSVTMRAQ